MLYNFVFLHQFEYKVTTVGGGEGASPHHFTLTPPLLVMGVKPSTFHLEVEPSTKFDILIREH
jgi:hypothetical protein